MKVLHVISSGGMYGAEAVILNLAKALRSMQHETVLGVFVHSGHPASELYERALAEGVAVHRIECNGQLDRSVPGAIRELIRSTGADVLHAHGYKSDLYSYFAARGEHIPLVSTCHTWYDNDAKVRLYGFLDRWILKKYAAVVAVSDEVRQRLLSAGVPDRRIRLIRNGIDLDAFSPRPVAQSDQRETLSIGLVGRLSREKGIDIFLKAAALVLASMPNVQFSVAGDGPDRDGLKALIQALDIQNNARLLGRLADPSAYYRSLDLLVSASRQEGLPIALLEGMAAALPLVATAVGEVPRVVQQERTGLIVPPEDVEALAQGMLLLLRDAEKRRQFGAAGRLLVAEEFSSARMARDYLAVYQEAIHRRRDFGSDAATQKAAR